jgi:hypothetical protein
MGSVREIGQLRLVSEPQERDRPVNSAFPAAALVLLVGITIPASAREGRGQGGPAQQQAKPVQQQQRQDRPAAREPAQIGKPAHQSGEDPNGRIQQKGQG